MGFEDLNCLFSQVSPVHARVDKLAGEVLCFDASNEVIGHFIVESVENGLDSCICETLAACITPLDQVISPPAFDWFSQDGIGVTVVECECEAVAL